MCLSLMHNTCVFKQQVIHYQLNDDQGSSLNIEMTKSMMMEIIWKFTFL